MSRTTARCLTLACVAALAAPAGRAAAQSCDDGRTAAAPPLPNWGFEYELVGWTAEGTAFANQPTVGNNVKVARRPADGQAPPTVGGDYWVNPWQDFLDQPYPIGHKGTAWIGTYENHPRTTAARLGDVQGDGPKGRLTSSQFTLTQPWLSMLVGGGDLAAGVRIELQVVASDYEALRLTGGTAPDDRVGCYVTVMRAAGQRSEVLRRVSWDVSRLVRPGAPVRARLMIVDDGDGAWGHLNVDDIQFSASPPPPAPPPVTPVFGFADTHAHPVANLGAGGLYWGKVGGNWRTTDIAADLGGDDGKGHGAATITGQIAATVLDSQAIGYFANRLDPGTIGACLGLAGVVLEIAQFEARHPGPHTVAAVSGLATTSLLSVMQAARGWLTSLGGKVVEPCVRPALDAVFQHYGSGPPRFMGWPKWSTQIHQGMHITWIRRAYDGGQRLMSALVVNPSIFEYVMKPAGAPLTPDRDAIEKQVIALKQIVDANRDWMEIALGPADARRIIASNKLAVILGTEIDTMGNLGFPSVDAEVAWLHGLGIRQVTPVHFVDNLLGAPAVYNDLFDTLDNFVTRSQPPRPGYPGWYEVENGCPDWRSRECIRFRLGKDQFKAADAALFGTERVPFIDIVPGVYPHDEYFGPKLEGQRNKGGLTDAGNAYLRALMKRGMIVAVDHMSDHTLDATLGLAERNGYPVLSDHADFREQALLPETETSSEHKVAHESTKTRAAAERILRLGGMISPITIPQDVADGPGRPGAAVVNDNPGSSKTWAQKYLYAVELAGPGGFVGVGTDYAFLGKPSPRFGTDTAAELAGDVGRARTFFPAYPAKAESVALARRQLGLRQGQGVKYDSPIREYRYHDRFQSTDAWSQEERDIWEALAAVKAGRNPFAAPGAGGLEGPATVVERTVFQQNKIVNLAKGFFVTDPASEEATGRHGFIALGDNSFWERRAAWLAKTAPAGAAVVPAELRSPDDGPEVARLYGVIKPIWDTWTRMEQGLGPSQPAMKRLVTLGRDFDYNLDGFANYGMLPDFVQDLRNVGLHDLDAAGNRVPGPSILTPLMRSAEGYVRMWDKAVKRSGEFGPTGPRP